MEKIERFKSYYPFELDDFQLEAIREIAAGNSVIVSAPTGAGKTVIAEFAIEQSLEQGSSVIYTTPLKALSNQKFRDFKVRFGEPNVGIVTGDVVINRDAPILIMTTEIYRNMLYQDPASVSNVTCAVLDEIHYLCDEERGTVWEEVIINCPDDLQLICLSASIEKVERFATWASNLKGKRMSVITSRKRPVPLHHFYYVPNELIAFIKNETILRSNVNKINNRIKNLQKKLPPGFFFRHFSSPKHIAQMEHSLLMQLEKNNMLPAIFFKFSRAGCEASAMRLKKKIDTLLNREERRQVEAFQENFIKDMSREELMLEQTDKVFYLSLAGLAVHHAGLIPKLKEYVEQLFTLGLLKAVFATETLALGVNMPARTTVITSMSKYGGGEEHKELSSTDYIQLTGRAGRRGIDEIGYAVVQFEPWTPFQRVLEIASGQPDELISRFRLGYNTVLNVIENHGIDNALPFLKKSFAYYLLRTSGLKSIDFDRTYRRILNILIGLSYIEGGRLTPKGQALRYLHGPNELLLSELIWEGVLEKMSVEETCALLSSLTYDGEKRDRMDFHLPKSFRTRVRTRVENKFMEIAKLERGILPITKGPNFGAAGSTYLWSLGVGFSDLAKQSDLDEGDIIRSIRQTVETIRQVQKYASDNPQLLQKLEMCMDSLYRDIVIASI